MKRVVQEFVRMVDREVSLLRESDTHPHVIRYFCMVCSHLSNMKSIHALSTN